MSAQQDAQKRYETVMARVYMVSFSGGYAFGLTISDPVPRVIFIGVKRVAQKIKGRWQLIPEGFSLNKGDIVEARIFLGVGEGKCPFAAFWRRTTVTVPLYDGVEVDEYEWGSYDSDDADWWDLY